MKKNPEKSAQWMKNSRVLWQPDDITTAWRLPDKLSPKIDHKIVSNIKNVIS